MTGKKYSNHEMFLPSIIFNLRELVKSKIFGIHGFFKLVLLMAYPKTFHPLGVNIDKDSTNKSGQKI